jgi:ABC-type nitrate/sulfonate/bicarbonate transport system substrate-binding protein
LFNAGLFTALEYGYFQNEGLEVELLPEATRTSQTLPLAGGGEVDVVSAPLTPTAVNAISKGMKLRFVAGRGVIAPECGGGATIYGRKDSFPNRLRDLSELRGKRLELTARGGQSEFFLDILLTSAGLTRNDVDIRLLNREESLIALVNGALDLMIDWDADRRLTEVSDTVFLGPSIGPILGRQQLSFIYFGKRLLEDDPEIGGAFLAGYLKGTRDFVQGANPKWLDEYIAKFSLDGNEIKARCRSYLTRDGTVDFASIERYVAWASKNGYCPNPVAIDKMVDTRFLELAWKKVGRNV